jgi:inner membrane transporter RhtA
MGRAAIYLAVSAIFHYLGPALAVLLFRHIDPLGVAWLRIASAAAVFAAWRRPWRFSRTLLALGAVLAAMNIVFYLAVARLPLATVGAIEFLGVIVLAAAGARNRRNLLALILAVGGVVALTDLGGGGDGVGYVFAFANCALFMLYVILGDRISGDDGVDRLGASMLIAAVLITPVGLPYALPSFVHPLWLLAGIAVGVCSSVIPYVSDQLALARLKRSTFALMLCLLPACAALIGAVVLRQIPTVRDLAGIALVMAGLVAHRDRAASA